MLKEQLSLVGESKDHHSIPAVAYAAEVHDSENQRLRDLVRSLEQDLAAAQRSILVIITY